MSDQLSAEAIDWLKQAAKPTMSKEDVETYFQTINPRNVFMKNLPANSKVLDLGAGGGEMAVLRTWPTFPRPDIQLYAISLDDSPGFKNYAGKFIGDFERSTPSFGTNFDGVLCCHFIEHISSFERVIDHISKCLRPGGRAYIEWPHHISKLMPTRDSLAALGYDVFTMNFHDDLTHLETWDCEALKLAAKARGLAPEACGQMVSPYLAEKLRDCGLAHRDKVNLTFALWAKFGWCQYLILQKDS